MVVMGMVPIREMKIMVMVVVRAVILVTDDNSRGKSNAVVKVNGFMNLLL